MMLVQRLGFTPELVPYLDGWDTQRRIHHDVVSGAMPDTLLLLEHASTYTAGKRTEPHERPDDGTDVIDVDRGGKITWHGPGQLVGYPIIHLDDPVDVVAYMRRLEQMMIQALSAVGISGVTIHGRSGVWLTDGGRQDKIAAIGVRVERGVTMHGFAINCNNSLDPFSHIIPCGLTDAGVTTIAQETGVTVTPEQLSIHVENAFLREFERVTA